MFRNRRGFLVGALLSRFLSDAIGLECLEELIFFIALSLVQIDVIIDRPNEIVVEELLEFIINYFIIGSLPLISLFIVI